jgi:hypothetical protein
MKKLNIIKKLSKPKKYFLTIGLLSAFLAASTSPLIINHFRNTPTQEVALPPEENNTAGPLEVQTRDIT